MLEFLEVPGGNYLIGTTTAGLDRCVEEWGPRLIRADYTPEIFREWIEKEFPAHPVTCDGFEMSRTLVSNGDVAEFLVETGAAVPESYTWPVDHPCWGVSMEWALSFAAWLSMRGDYLYRLPTETEWEIAARGPDAREYPYGLYFDSARANTIESGIGSTTAVEHYAAYPGPFGHLDLAGNVEEWVSTPYRVYPGGRLIRDNLFERFGDSYAVLRGGSFACGGDLSRAARRHGPFPDPQFLYTGFRLVRDAKIKNRVQ